MDKQARNGIYGLLMIGAGAALAAAGVVLVVPVCTAWSKDKFLGAYQKGREGVISGIETAAGTLGEVTGKLQQPLGEAVKAAKHTTAVAAGAIESAAHYVKEHVQ